MELWIRSQDREHLSKIESVWYATKGIHCRVSSGFYCTLGEYSTYERALEVLDDINNVLKGNIEKHINKFDLYRDNNVIIYEMSKE